MTNTDTSLIQAVGDSMRAETLPHAPPTHVVQSLIFYVLELELNERFP